MTSRSAIGFCREHGIDVLHDGRIIMSAPPEKIDKARRWLLGGLGWLPTDDA